MRNLNRLIKTQLDKNAEDAKQIALDRMVGMARGGDFKACKYILDTSEFAPIEKKEIKNVDTVIKVTMVDA